MQQSILAEVRKEEKDPIESTLQNMSQNIIAVIFGLLPLLFIPIPYIPLDYFKTVAVIVGMLLAIIFFSLSVLRSGKMVLAAPLALWGLWAVAAVTAVSAILSGDMQDAFIGDHIGVHTSLFVILLALIATATLVIGQTRETIMRMYIILAGSAVILGVFHVARLLFGSQLLSLGIFESLVSTPIGGWNDLALFFGLAVILSLVALEQLPLTFPGKVFFSTVVGFSLVILAAINFFGVWLVLCLISLVVLMYSLTRDRFSEKTLTFDGKKIISLQSVLLSLSVFIVSLVFIIGGGAVGGAISKITGISYVEVRPSFEATMDITRNVFNENAFVGIGPNKFVDAWRLYKDPSINQTVFWATDFNGANGYLTTFFATTGIAGIVAWIVFFTLFLWAGFRMLFRSVHTDRFWYFIGSSSFAAAVYLWGMSAIYVPGAAILLLAGIFTTVTFVAYSSLVSIRPLSFSIVSNKRAGFILVGIVMVVIVASASALYYTGRHYVSVHTYGNAVTNAQAGNDLAQAEEQIAAAYASSKNDTYALQLASYQLAKMNALAGLTELTEEQQKQFQTSVQNGINAGLIATNDDPTDSLYWSTLGSIYSVLAAANVEGAQDKAREAFGKARSFDPTNPLHALLEAQLNSRTGDLESARARAMDAVALKPNYTDALFFITQLDIAEGKVGDAVNTTRSIISLEPNNPARYYQLGVLQSAAGDVDASIAAFEQAVRLDANYANARYFLALALAQKGDSQSAIGQLQSVLELNPGNETVIALIEQLQSGEPLNFSNDTPQVTEPQTVNDENGAVTTTENPDTSLISPVNTVGNPENGSDEPITEEGS